MNLQNMGFKLMAKDEHVSCQVQARCQKDGCKNNDKGEQHEVFKEEDRWFCLCLI
jgi:hypothetical protein